MPAKEFDAFTRLDASDVNAYLANKAISNAVINGAFDFWQRGTTLSTYGFLADRFLTDGSGTTNTQSQQTFTPGAAPLAGLEGNFFHRSVVSSSAGSGNYSLLLQRLEDVRTFAGQTVTVSFYAKADASKPIAIELEQVFGSGGSSIVRTFVAKPTLTSSWARYSASITVPSISGKTLGGGSYLGLNFWFDAGSAFNARTSSLGQQSGTFDIWGVQLEAGTVANDFRRNANSIQGELAACQRYYFRTSNAGSFGNHATGWGYSGTNALMYLKNPIQLRSAPSSIEFGNLRVDDGVGAAAVTAMIIAPNLVTSLTTGLDVTTAGSLAQFRPLGLSNNNNTAGFVAVSAEL